MAYTIREIPPPRKIKWVCDSCGSDNVQARWMCVWDVKKQEWVPEDWDDPDYCMDCSHSELREEYI